MKIGVVVAARLDSTRLPGKVLTPLDHRGNCSIDLILNAVKQSQIRDNIVIATTNRPLDEPIENHVRALGVSIFKGATNDLVQRHYQAGIYFGFDWQIRITADCPLITPALIDGCLHQFKVGCDETIDLYTTKTRFEPGLDLEFIRTSALKTHHTEMSALEREHLTMFFYNKLMNRVKFFRTFDPRNLNSETFLLDTRHDLDCIKKALGHHSITLAENKPES